MKKRILLLAGIAAFSSLALNSCTKVANTIIQSIDLDGIEVTVNVPVTSVTDSMTYSAIGSATVNVNVDSIIKSKTANTYGINNVDEFKLKSCELTILTGSSTNNNFANFKSAKASLFTNAKTTQSLVGEVTNNPNVFATTLSLPVNTTTNYKDYLPASGPVVVTYDVEGALRAPVTAPMTVKVVAKYSIHVTL